MTDQQNPEPEGDVEGHLRAPKTRAEGSDTDDDVEGHLRAPKTRAEGDDEDDVEGHRFKAR